MICNVKSKLCSLAVNIALTNFPRLKNTGEVMQVIINLCFQDLDLPFTYVKNSYIV